MSKHWMSQAELGRLHDRSAIAIGKLLVGAGAKDPVTKEPTRQALEREWAKPVLNDPGAIYVVWLWDVVFVAAIIAFPQEMLVASPDAVRTCSFCVKALALTEIVYSSEYPEAVSTRKGTWRPGNLKDAARVWCGADCAKAQYASSP